MDYLFDDASSLPKVEVQYTEVSQEVINRLFRSPAVPAPGRIATPSTQPIPHHE